MFRLFMRLSFFADFKNVGAWVVCLAGPALCVVLFGPSWCSAQESSGDPDPPRPWIIGETHPFSQPIFTDRPTFSLGPGTIAQGHVQFETGYTFSHEDGHPDVQTHTVPETLIRIGLVRNFELRVEWPNVTVINHGSTVDGLRDLGLGFKLQVFQQQGFRPRLSVAGRLSVPTGSKDFSSDRLDPELRTIVAYALNERMGFFGNLNIAGPTSQQTRFVQVSASAGLTAALRDRLNAFVEYFGLYPRNVARGSGHFLQTGVIYRLTYNLQLDARIGGGLTHGTDDVFTGAGVSWRF